MKDDMDFYFQPAHIVLTFYNTYIHEYIKPISIILKSKKNSEKHVIQY